MTLGEIYKCPYNGLGHRLLRHTEVDDDDEERADDVHDDGLGPPPTIHMSVTCLTRDEDLMSSWSLKPKVFVFRRLFIADRKFHFEIHYNL